MVFAQSPGDAGAAFINRTEGNDEADEAFTRAVRSLTGEVAGDDGSVHNINDWFAWKFILLLVK